MWQFYLVFIIFDIFLVYFRLGVFFFLLLFVIFAMSLKLFFLFDFRLLVLTATGLLIVHANLLISLITVTVVSSSTTLWKRPHNCCWLGCIGQARGCARPQSSRYGLGPSYGGMCCAKLVISCMVPSVAFIEFVGIFLVRMFGPSHMHRYGGVAGHPLCPCRCEYGKRKPNHLLQC